MSSNNSLMNVYNKETIDEILIEKLGFDKDEITNFNFAVIDQMREGIQNVEYWILINAYYDYDDELFHKIDLDQTSFGIQMQAKGAFPGEATLGYEDNSGINVWRNPSAANLSWAPETQKVLFNQHIIAEYDEQHNIKTFQVSCGWSNAFMFDSYGGMTVGGTGFEIDGNGIFPYTRVADCIYTNPTDGKEYGYFGFLQNAYNSTRYGWDGDPDAWGCDSNDTYSWLVGLHAPVDENLGGNFLDMDQADFRIMYNDSPYDAEDIHTIATNRWKTILKVTPQNIQAMVNGTLTTLGAGGGSTDIVQTITDGDTTHAPSGDAVYDALALKENSSNKSSNMTTDTGSTTKYPTVKAVQDYIDSIIGDADDWLTS